MILGSTQAKSVWCVGLWWGKPEAQNMKMGKAWSMFDLIIIIAKNHMMEVIHIRTRQFKLA